VLNVWRNGSLIQDLQTTVNHQPGRDVLEAHPVVIVPESRLASLRFPDHNLMELVDSSHHQAIRTPGDNLRVTAVSPVDGVIEAVELNSPDHFVVAVQWHPERTYLTNLFSRALFDAFYNAVNTWELVRIHESVVQR
jgi:putative glutamine amidotransferase